MPTISDRLINVTGAVTEHENIYVRSHVRSGEDHLITAEQERIPVGEDGLVTVTIESGPAVLIIQREATVYSRADIIPLWVPEYDTTIREAMELGKTHQNMDGDTAQDLVEQILSTISGAVAEGLAQIEEAAEGTVDLSSYATIVYVDEMIDQIELTPGKDGEDGASAYEVWLSAGNTGTETDFLSSLKGEDGQDGEDGEDGISPHIDQISGNWFLGDHDTGVQAQGPKGDPGDGNGGGTSAVLKTTIGIPQDTEGVEPGEIRIETFSGVTFRAKGSFGMIPADMSAVYPVGQDPTGMPGLEQLLAGTILTDDGTNFWQLQTGGEVKVVYAGNSSYAQQLYGYGSMPPGTAFKIDRDNDPEYPAGLYLISDVPPVNRWELFTLSPDAVLTYLVNHQYTKIQELESRIAALENQTE